MMMDLDETLAALRTAPAADALKRLDAGVFERIDAEAQATRGARRSTLAIVAGAVSVGIAGAAVPAPPRTIAPMPLTANALAPSTLLGGAL